MFSLSAATQKNGTLQHKDSEVFKVLMTHDYDKFKIMDNNREVNLLHVKRLIESFREKHLVCPIIVNDKFYVIDGQHRLMASKETGLPIYYIIIPSYGIEDVRILNTNQKNWTKADYLEMYCYQEVDAYLELKKFMSDFPEFGMRSAERIVTLKLTNQTTGNIQGQRAAMKSFEEGKLKIPNITKSYIYARKIMDFKPFYNGFHKSTFVSAVMPLFASKVYDHKEMMHKLSTCPVRLIDCLNIESYRMLLEEIYNHRRREGKVSFRYV